MIGLIYSSDFEVKQRKKYIWIPVVILGLIFSFMLLISGSSDSGGYLLLGVLIMGGSFLIPVIIFCGITLNFIELSMKKQYIIFGTTTVLMIILNILQFYGMLRPGLLE